MALVGKNLSATAGGIRDKGPIPGSGRSHGGGSGDPLQCSCLENPMDSEPGGLQFMGLQRVRHDWGESMQAFRSSGDPFIRWRTLGLFPRFDHGESSSSEYLCTQFLCRYTFSILLVSYPGMRLLSCVVNLRLTLGWIVGWFSKATASFCVSTSMRIRAPVPLCLSHAWLLSICLMTVTTLWMKWYLTWFQCAEP